MSTPQDASVAADMGQMKTKIEENKSSISKVEALPRSLDAPPWDTPSSGVCTTIVVPLGLV